MPSRSGGISAARAGATSCCGCFGVLTVIRYCCKVSPEKLPAGDPRRAILTVGASPNPTLTHFHCADACNVLCQIERDAGNHLAAVAAVKQAYRLAWCDGPPWAYHFGLENAKKQLRELGVAEPEMEKE